MPTGWTPAAAVRPWKTGRVHLAEGSNVVVLELGLPYSTEFGRESRKFASGVRKYGKFDDGRWQTRRAAGIISKGKGKGKCIYTSRFFKALRHGSHSVTCNHINACLYLVSVHQMVPPQTEVAHLIAAYYSFIYPERLSRPGWLTYNTHISGHRSAASRAQDRESSPAKDRRSTNCATKPTSR